MRVTVPANILLLGEYAVLEEGGVGVILAVEPRVIATLTDAPRLEFVGKWGSGRTSGTAMGKPDLFACAVDSVADYLGVTTGEIRRLPMRVEVDSTPFYDASGRKRGLGSSAAAAVALCYSLLARPHSALGSASLETDDGAGAGESSDALLEPTFTCALRAHRTFQGGRGSGYDIAASVYGGIGRFEGGASPRFFPAALPWLPPLTMFHGASPVRTKDAVVRYEAWKASHPRQAERFLTRSNECAEQFLAASSWDEAVGWVEKSRELAAELGATVGAPGAIRRPAGFDGVVKAVGAGSELGIAFGILGGGTGPSDGPVSSASLRIAFEGVGRELQGEKGGNDARS